MYDKPFSFAFFVSTLGYRRVVRKGKSVFVKRLDRKRESVVATETLHAEYENVCKKLVDEGVRK